MVSFWDKARETAGNRLYELQHTEVNSFMFIFVFYFHFKQNSLHLLEATLYLFWHMVYVNFILMHPSVFVYDLSWWIFRKDHFL